MSTEERITELVHEGLEIDKSFKIEPTTDLRTLGADSLDIMELVLSIEDEFDVALPDEDVDRFLTVQDLTKFIEEAK